MTRAITRRRLIYCVDGTWYGPDGKPTTTFTQSSIYRIHASIKKGIVPGTKPNEWIDQQSIYLEGIGAAEDVGAMQKLRAGLYGTGCEEQIKRIYETCCTLNENDEVWFFGFSRGAFVVRAVAGLLHNMLSLQSSGSSDFEKDYQCGLKVYKQIRTRGRQPSGQLHRHYNSKTQFPPMIKFIGALDTVKQFVDHDLFDISFNDSTEHMRHALALHENRPEFAPALVQPGNLDSSSGRSCIQAWFAGAHSDIGGSSPKAGLALYPLQWMLLEAQSFGLQLSWCGDFGGRVAIDDPLQVVFPDNEGNGKGIGLWSCEMQNGVKMSMHDIRRVHTLPKYASRYSLMLNRNRNRRWPREKRRVFDENQQLEGWFPNSPQGTVIHPSVYLILDESIGISLHGNDSDLHTRLEDWREQTLGAVDGEPNFGFWSEELSEGEPPKALRILVCGNTGVGKSTLINRVFGVEVTTESERQIGHHDIRQEIRGKGRDDLIIYDSGGFVAGGAHEVEIVRNFLREKSTEADINDCLHVIWFCVDVSDQRLDQTATRALFNAVSEYAQDVPIVIVTTKSDKFLSEQSYKRYKQLQTEQQNQPLLPSLRRRPMIDMNACEDWAEQELQDHVDRIRQDLLAIEGGRFDDCVAVSKDDQDSIKTLTSITCACFTSDRVRFLYIRAQIAKVDLKIDLAIKEAMLIYVRGIVRGSRPDPSRLVTRVHSWELAGKDGNMRGIFKTIFHCFNLPTLTPKEALDLIAYHTVKLSRVGVERTLSASSEDMSYLDFGCWVERAREASLPLIQVPSFVAPSDSRILLHVAAMMILTLARSFQEAAARHVGQPVGKDLRAAAIITHHYSADVLADLDSLMTIPGKKQGDWFNMYKASQVFEAVVEKYRERVMVHERRESVVSIGSASGKSGEGESAVE